MQPERREQCILHKEQISTMAKDIHEIKKMMLGNGVVGVAEMARRSFDYMIQCKQTKSGLLDWTFRAIITIMVGYIAICIGLK